MLFGETSDRTVRYEVIRPTGVVSAGGRPFCYEAKDRRRKMYLFIFFSSGKHTADLKKRYVFGRLQRSRLFFPLPPSQGIFDFLLKSYPVSIGYYHSNFTEPTKLTVVKVLFLRQVQNDTGPSECIVRQ